MTKKMMPSAAQVRVLEAMANGGDLRSIWNEWHFEGGEAVNGTTAKSLQLAGRINCYWRTGEIRKYEITALGRHALEAAQSGMMAAVVPGKGQGALP